MDGSRSSGAGHGFHRRVTRRQAILGIGGVALATTVLAACGAQAPAAAPTAAKPAAPQAAPTLVTQPALPASAPTAAPTTAAAGAPTAAPTAAAAAAPTAAPTAAAVAKPVAGKVFNGAWPYDIPPTGHFNRFVPKALTLGIYEDLIQMPMAKYDWASGKWTFLLATETKFVLPDKFQATLRKGVKWSDGNPFTSKDVATTLNIQRMFRNPLWNYIDTIDTPDDTTVVLHMKQPSTVVERYMHEMNIVSAAVFGKYGDQVAALFKSGKTMDDAEGKAILQDFQTFRPPAFVASGPFNVDIPSINNAQLTLNKVPTAWNADKILFDKIVLYNGETPTVTPLVLAKQVDYATHGFAPATLKALADEGVQLVQTPTYGGTSIGFNFADPKVQKVFGDKRVRQAMAMAINRDQAGFVAGGVEGTGVKYYAGFSDVLVPQWFSADQLKLLNKYETNVDAAAKLLTDVGWKKGSDGVWATADGTRVEFDLLSVTEFVDTMAIATNSAEQLTRFGMKITVRSVTFTQQPLDIDKGNFTLGMIGWGAGQPHPHFSFVTDLLTHNTLAVNNGGKGMSFPLQQKTDSVGDIDLEKALTDSANGLDTNAQKDLVVKVSRAFNELLPIVPIYERWAKNPTLDGVRVTNWPKPNDPIYISSPYADSFVIRMLLDGTLKPV